MSRFLQKIFLTRLFESNRSVTKNGGTSSLIKLGHVPDEMWGSNPFSKAKSEASNGFKPMLLMSFLIVAFAFLKPMESQAQFVINNQGCVIGDFGVNSSLYAGEALGGTAPAGPVDWFKKSTGRNVIIQDPATVAALQGRLQTEVDPVFEVRMNGGLGSFADSVDSQNYKVLIDAIWARDYNSFSDDGLDFSGFNQSAKNGQNPSVDWFQQSRNIGGKNDVIDVAGHMFRTVTPTSDDLWFMGLINIAEPNGDSYMDFEFFVDDVKVVNGAFTTAGADAGHTAFQFNADGSIKRVGDMIYNMGLVNGGSQADVEIRIWVSKTDYDTYSANPPANLPFTFGAEFDGDGNGATFGYASVIPKDQGSDVCGYVNLDGEFPEAAPWGTKNGNSNTYATSYQPYAVAELGINLTAFGLDNKLSSGADNDPCFFPWITYMVKTRTSNSFTASLSDMAGPFTWGQAGVAIVEQNDPPSISCESPTATLTATPVRNDATYTWSTTDGNIVDGTEADGTITKTGSSIEVDAAGNYTVTMTLPNGCEYTSAPIEVTYDNTVSCNPSWKLTKTATEESFDAVGDVINYTIQVENDGDVDISAVTVADPKATSGPTYVSGDTGNDDILASGETWVYSATYTVTQADIDAGSFENTATASGTIPNGTIPDAEGTETVNAVQNPSWTLTKSTTDTYAAAGDELTYSIEVENTGNVSISSVVVVDDKATTGPTYVSGDTNEDDILGVGETWVYTATSVVAQSDVDAGSFTNEATATGTPAGGTLEPAKGSETVNATQTPSWTLTKSSTDTYDAAGDVLNYTIEVENTGNVSISEVSVTDDKASTGPTYESGDENENDILDVGETWTYSASSTVNQADVDAGSFTNEATATGTPAGGTLEPAKGSKIINAIQNPALTLVKTGIFNDENENGRADTGETISYTFLVTNTGNVTLTNVTVSDPMVTVSGGPISLAVGEDSGNTFTATYTIDQDDINAGEVVNTATADSDESDPKDSEETTKLPQEPFLEFSKSTDTKEYSTLGEVIRYRLTLVNTGNLPIENIQVSDPLATTGPDYLGGDSNSNGILEIGEAWIYVATVTVTQKHLDEGSFINIAKATGKSVDGTELEITDQQKVVAVQNPSWTLTKSSTDTYDAAGDVLNYTIAVKNTGNVTISNVVVSDPKASSGPTYSSGDTNSNNKLDAGETWTYTASATVTQADVDAGSFINEATATGTPAGGALNPSKGSETVEAIQNPSWTITKTADEKSFGEVGDVLNYTIVVTNTGNITISNVSVSDPKATTGPTYKTGDVNSNNKLDVGETWTYTATYSVKAADIEAGSFTNEASVTGTPAGGTLPPAKGTHTVVALVARPDVESTPFNTSVSGNASENDTYPAGSTFSKTSNPENGTVEFNADGKYTYQPKEGFTGVDTFTYKVCLPSPNGTVCEETTVTIVVGPNAVDDKFVALQNRDVTASVVGNDNYPASSIFTNTSTPSNGTLKFNPDGSFTYVPNANFTGKDTFTYKVCFTEGEVTMCEEATVEIEILPFDTEPDVNATFVNVPVNGNVATNDKVTEGTTYGDPGAPSTQPAGSNPELKLNSNGTFTFVTDVPGIYVYLVPVCPPVEGEECTLEPLTITVLDLNVEVNAPIAHTDIAETRQGKPVTLQTLSNDRPGGKSVALDPTSVKIMTQPKNGTVSVNPQTGDITYTPNPGFVGVDTYTYQVCDTSNPAKCVIADQKVTVLGENAPNSTLASDDFAVTSNKLPVSGNVLKNDTDSEGNTQTVTPQKISLPQGDFEIKANGEYTFTPKPGFVGPVEIVYEVCDNGTPGACAKATIYLLIVRNSIEAINDNFQSKPINGLKGGVAGNVLTNDLLNERPVKADEVVISILSDGGLKGVTIDALGNLNVPKGTPVGTYIVHYSICEVVDPTNCSDAIAVVEVFHGVDLAINKRAEETDLWEGDEFAYILTVGNVGDTDASEVVVIDNLPAGLEYKSAQLLGTTGLQLTTVVEGQKVTMKLPTLKAGQVVEIKLSVKARPLSAPSTETILNTASVASKETELKPADNTSSTAVRIQPFFIPNVITPNGDRKNDAFEIKGLGKFRSNEIVIFNRYGDHVFQKKGYQNDWMGEGLVAGTYFYILSVVDINGNPTEFKGWIQLIRE